MKDFHDCPYCGLELEQWSIRFHRSDRVAPGVGGELAAARLARWADSPYPAADAGVEASETEGLSLLSLCPAERCGYYVLRYRNGLTHWDRDVEAARLLRTVFGE